MSKICDKRGDISVDIVNYPQLYGDVLALSLTECISNCSYDMQELVAMSKTSMIVTDILHVNFSSRVTVIINFATFL